MTYTALRLECTERIATVTLNRPDRMNALDESLARELTAVAEQLAIDVRVRAVVLTGHGRAFCAGADLTPGALPFADQPPGARIGALLEQLFNPIVEAWVALPQPVIVAMNGVAAGGGVGLALSGDFLLMSNTASLAQVFVPQLAFIPDMGASFLLQNAIGSRRAAALTLTGGRLSASQALELGLASATCEPVSLLQDAHTLALQLAANPRAATTAAKRLFQPDPAELRAALTREARLQSELGDNADHAEAIRAFTERRSPSYA